MSSQCLADVVRESLLDCQHNRQNMSHISADLYSKLVVQWSSLHHYTQLIILIVINNYFISDNYFSVHILVTA